MTLRARTADLLVRVGRVFSAAAARIAPSPVAEAPPVEPPVELDIPAHDRSTDAPPGVDPVAWQRHLASGAPLDWLHRVAAHAPGLLDGTTLPQERGQDEWPSLAPSPSRAMPEPSPSKPSAAEVPLAVRESSLVVPLAASRTSAFHRRSPRDPTPEVPPAHHAVRASSPAHDVRLWREQQTEPRGGTPGSSDQEPVAMKRAGTRASPPGDAIPRSAFGAHEPAREAKARRDSFRVAARTGQPPTAVSPPPIPRVAPAGSGRASGFVDATRPAHGPPSPEPRPRTAASQRLVLATRDTPAPTSPPAPAHSPPAFHRHSSKAVEVRHDSAFHGGQARPAAAPAVAPTDPWPALALRNPVEGEDGAVERAEELRRRERLDAEQRGLVWNA